MCWDNRAFGTNGGKFRIAALGAGLGPVHQVSAGILVALKKMPVSDSLRRLGDASVRRREIRSGWDKGSVERHGHNSEQKRDLLIRFMFPDPAVQRYDQALLQLRVAVQCPAE